MTQDQPGDIRPGDIYEDCSFHPVLCTFNDGDPAEGKAPPVRRPAAMVPALCPLEAP